MKRNNWKKIFVYGMTVVLTIQLSGVLIHAQDTSAKDHISYDGIHIDQTDTQEYTDTNQNTTYIEEIAEDKEKDTSSQKTKKETKEKKKEKSSADPAVNYSQADLRLLSALIYCESNGEPYAGKLAVGIVVMNRKRSSKFPNTVKGVIEQPYQFGPVRNGSLNRTLSRYDSGKFDSAVDKDCIKAAKEALSGVKTVTYKGSTKDFSGYLYFNGRVSGAKYQIANHQFK